MNKMKSIQKKSAGNSEISAIVPPAASDRDTGLPRSTSR